jgi:restriction system protein
MSASPRPCALRISSLAQLNKNGHSKFENRVAWARFYLAKEGIIDPSVRGVWSLSERGQSEVFGDKEALALFKKWSQTFRKNRDIERKEAEDITAGDEDATPEQAEIVADHRSVLTEVLRKLSPKGFERFGQRLLREAGFIEVEVTGRSGDGGIDGRGVLRLNPLLTSKVLFQCKRHSRTISSSDVRDFQAACQGRAEKGIFLATASFSPDAKREASRDGAIPIELIDLDKVLELIEQLQLGVERRTTYVLNSEFFKQFESG